MAIDAGAFDNALSSPNSECGNSLNCRAWIGIWPEFGARIAAVPRKGQDSLRAKCGIARRTKSLGARSSWLATCTITIERNAMLQELGLFANVSAGAAGSDSFDAHAGSCRQVQHGKENFMMTLAFILDFLFGCHHAHLSRVFTLQGETYKVCCDCGAKYAYSMETMSIVRRVPSTSVHTRFRIA